MNVQLFSLVEFMLINVNRYFQLMEAWQENLAERQQLIHMAGKHCLFQHFSLLGLDEAMY